ncbi:ABC transporter substrate-binding protein [Bosea psychrotolerans]|uniref:NitT/TauT family transport system substrate-binding protein n=1 Tax=Bosea psychrotolerans TaxID=1871628 RepID=A0A2S4M0R0_9HYPH|nr:ABC transporter substrate-binding protein [Bosea psychrotolerans]POR48316.1 NitT/TauT family transport system substrate-binding protein [Bosea psychrotolerans]
MQALFSRRAVLAGAAAATALSAAPRRLRAAEAATITMAIQYGYAYLPVTVAEKLGLFAKQGAAAGLPGLTVKIQKISGAPAINDALISGSVDIGAYGLPGMLIAAEKTRGSMDIRGLAALVAGDNGLYTNKAEIKTLADFKPTDKIAVTSTTGQQGLLVRMAAEKAFGEGQSRRLDTMMIQLPHPDATSALITGGTISAYAAPHPYSDIVEKSPNVKRLFFFSDYLGERVTSGLLASKRAFVEANPQVAKAVVAAIDEAGAYIKANPRKAAEIFLESEKSSLALGETETMLTSVSEEWGVQPKGVMRFGTFMAKAGLLKAAPAKWQDTFFTPVAAGQGS